MTKPVLPADNAPRLYLDVVQPITSGDAAKVNHLLVVCGVEGDHTHPDPKQRGRMPVLTRTITLADFETQHQTPAGAPSPSSSWWSAVRKLQVALTNTIRLPIQMRKHAGNHAGNDVIRWAVESAITRKRMQCERNALALARLNARLVQSPAQGEANTLP